MRVVLACAPLNVVWVEPSVRSGISVEYSGALEEAVFEKAEGLALI